MCKCIPHRSVGLNDNEHSIPGWNDYIKDKHELARNAYLDWVYSGKPREGPVHYRMKATRARFKLPVRYCKQHADMLCADKIAKSLASHNYCQF